MYQHGSSAFKHFNEEFEKINYDCVKISMRSNDVVKKPKTFQVSIFNAVFVK